MTDTISETQNLLDKLKSLSLPRSRPIYADTAKALMQSQAQDDTTEEVPNTDDTVQSTTEVSTVKKDNSVPFELWETLAYDLALANTDQQTIANAYDLTIDQLYTLQDNPYFAKILQAKKDEVKQLGSDAAFAVKMRMVANRATPQLLRRLTDPSTANRDFLAMFKTVTELGQLIPQPVHDDTPQPTLIGASVVFNIGGVPGLEHLVQPNTTKAVDNTITDADWQEVVSHQTSELYDEELGEL